MIEPRIVQRPADVAGHYDELDHVYRKVWGEHVHHGLWTTGRESVAAATEALSMAVAAQLGLAAHTDPVRAGPGDAPFLAAAVGKDGLSTGTERKETGPTLVDIGCGYGGTAALFATRLDARVTGFTLSAAQLAVARARGDARLTFHLRDWLANDLPDAAFNGAYAIESTEHIADKARLFAQAARVLRPGGRLVICAWLAADAPTRWQVDHLLEPICREGRLPGLGTRAEYLGWAGAAGLAAIGYEDVSARVARTWTICARRFALRLLHDREARRLLRHGRDRAFALSVPRLILAYRMGVMRYGIFTFEKGRDA